MTLQMAIAYIPEFKLTGSITEKTKLVDNIFLLPKNSAEVKAFQSEIKAKGYKIKGGEYLYFEGVLEADGTLYEVFQGYSLALTFFNSKGRATCRAIKDLNSNSIELFIDEYDKFGYEPDDVILVKKAHLSAIEPVYKNVENQLTTKDFNPLRNSLEFFILFLSEKPIRTRILFLSICLESILLEGQTEGLSYKLSIRCANFLNAFYKNVKMDTIYNDIKNSYALRSKIIHGDDYKKESSRQISRRGAGSSELDHVYILEAIVKDVLSVIFSKQDLYDLSIMGQLGVTIDKKYILGC